MNQASLQDIAQKMRHLDICTFTTVTQGGALLGRPMSNNADVEYDGNSYYFTYDKEQIAKDIESNPNVSLGFEGKDHLYICVTGLAKLSRDKAQLEAHWVPDLDKWFENGIDTPGIVMIQVVATSIRYWQGMEEGEWRMA